MKPRKIWIIVLIAVLALAGGLGWYFLGGGAGEQPFADLDASDLQYATLYLSPPEESLGLNQQMELEELAPYLRELTIYERDDSYVDYCGQTVRYHLGMADGSEHWVTAFAPFLVIDDVGYRTDYESCEALCQYSNDIMRNTCQQQPAAEYDNGPPPQPAQPMSEPPVLCVISGSTSTDALRGGYSWTIYHEDGAAEATIADSAHPLDCQNLLTCLETTEATARLEFQVPPIEIEVVRCWSDGAFGNPTVESQSVELDGQTIHLLPGGHVYEVMARWEGEDYEGSAGYSFWIDRQP